ncbi:hypothetical protein BJ741DRAFT_654926 [Chytriomyces cf. hyalinus JEL632]|nr:hypothetical protein BJ741DRAFT_654926 [Chytriomyces cf. hyalinus JEL632]
MPVPAQEAIQPDEQLETTFIPELLCELDKIIVVKPCKMQIAATEKVSGYFLFMRKLARDLEVVNKLQKTEDSQAELIQMKDFQMVDSNPGTCSKWAALSERSTAEVLFHYGYCNQKLRLQARRATFQEDSLRKFQVFRPAVKNIPVTELRQGKIRGIRMIMRKMANFTLEELDILERNHIQLVKSTEDVDREASSASNETEQESLATNNQTNGPPQSHNDIDLNLAAGEMEAVLVAAGLTDNTQFKTPAYGKNDQSADAMSFGEIDFEALLLIIGMQSYGS